MNAQWPATVQAMENTITLRHACVAYIAAVTGAAVFCISPTLFGGRLSEVAAMFGLAWLAAFVCGLIPFTLTIRRANKLGKKSLAYFAGSGTLAAITAAAVILAASAFACDDGEDSSNLFAMFLLLAASGVTGGSACWLALRVQARLDTRVRMS